MKIKSDRILSDRYITLRSLNREIGELTKDLNSADTEDYAWRALVQNYLKFKDEGNEKAISTFENFLREFVEGNGSLEYKDHLLTYKLKNGDFVSFINSMAYDFQNRWDIYQCAIGKTDIDNLI